MDRAVEEVDRLGAVFDVAEQLVVGNARQSFAAAFLQAVEEALVAQAHGDDQLGGAVQGGGLGERVDRRGRGNGGDSGDRVTLPLVGRKHGRVVEDFAFFVLDPEGDDRHEVRVVDALDELQRAEFLAALAAAEADDLHRRLGPARRGRLPDLAEPAAAEKLHQPVSCAGNGLIANDVISGHGAPCDGGFDPKLQAPPIVPFAPKRRRTDRIALFLGKRPVFNRRPGLKSL